VNAPSEKPLKRGDRPEGGIEGLDELVTTIE